MKELENISKEGYNYIEEILIEEYGYRYEKLVRDRLSKTNYIFKSLPDTTYFSLKELGYDPKKYKSLEQYYRNYINYKQVEDYLDKKNRKKIYRYLKEKLSLTDEYLSKHLDEILNLDYQVFSEEYINILNTTNDKKLKSIILKKQDEFVIKLIKLGLPLINIDVLFELYTYISLLTREKQLQLLKLTNFGKEITSYISKALDNTSFYKSLNYTREILFNNSDAITCSIKEKKKNYRIVYIPILKLKYILSIDHVLIHESIHAIESNNRCSGITGLKKDNYVLNELKTESKAIKLHNKMKKDGISIFDTDQNKDKTATLYEPFIPLMTCLMKDYEEIFNYCSLYNKVSPLYRVFGRDNFKSYSKDVSMLFEQVKMLDEMLGEDLNISINITKYKDQVDKMKSYARRKKIK